jgi:cysteine synthase A
MSAASTVTDAAAEVDPLLAERIHALRHLVGNTPLLAIDATFRGKKRRVFAKAENLNMTGSIKDRMALHILARGYAKGALSPGATVFEATSGNTGIAFAGIGRALGHPVAIFMPNWMSRERIDLIRSLGATIRLVAPDEGGFLGSIRMAERRRRRRPARSSRASSRTRTTPRPTRRRRDPRSGGSSGPTG